MHASEASQSAIGAVLKRLDSTETGLSDVEARARLDRCGPNAVRTHRVSALAVLLRQLRSAVLILLAVTAVVSSVVGDPLQAGIIGAILGVSIGLSFVNEYRAERAAAALHSGIRHYARVRRDGRFVQCEVTHLVPGDVVSLSLGEVVPADVKLMETHGLECNESVLTGESIPSEKCAASMKSDASQSDSTDLALMGTVVSAGDGVGVVYATGASAMFGGIAAGLGERQPETDFQSGLRRFSYLLLWVAMTLTAFILVVGLLLGRPLLDSALFALAIAVGITPQLLPAVVSTSLAAGSRRLAKVHVLVKRLVCIEDLGDVDVLITDKTGTLTDGHITLIDAIDAAGGHSDEVLRAGLLATDDEYTQAGGLGANALDAALAQAADPGLTAGTRRVAALPFDHTRRAASALIDDGGERWLIVKGAPEQVLARCVDVPTAATTTLDAQFADGRRVVAVAIKEAPSLSSITAADETGLRFQGFLCFADEPKAEAAESLRALARLGIEVKIATGDNPRVAEKVCAELGLAVKGTITGSELDVIDADDYAPLVAANTIFARVSPEQKAQLITAARKIGRSVAFLGDGVNDALALHAADVGISVDTATDVAKDAADVVLMEKDLGVLVAGVTEGRRIFANTIKYVLMGTSSNFGNMFSAAAASAVLPFLPMLPSQILLNNLLYDTSQLAIPTDRVDPEQLRAPSHWNIAFIRRFMLTFGPISSLFDFLTFALMLGVLHAAPAEFRTGWFIESLATQTLIIVAIRTRRVPFTRSRPGGLLLGAAVAVVVAGIALIYSPATAVLGFAPLPWYFFAALAAMTVVYLALVEVTKKYFYRRVEALGVSSRRTRGRTHRIHRRAARFSHHGSLPQTP
jgi:Mg2+-importing ATPase